jgi:shikimate dehydrogenase
MWPSRRTPGLERLANGSRGGAIRGVNVTVPFKEAALTVADRASELAQGRARRTC